AAGEAADRPLRIGRRADELDHLADSPAPPFRPAAGERNTPARTVEPEPDEVDAADPDRAVEAVALRQVADLGIGCSSRVSEEACGSRPKRLQAEHDVEERRLAGTVRAGRATSGVLFRRCRS